MNNDENVFLLGLCDVVVQNLYKIQTVYDFMRYLAV